MEETKKNSCDHCGKKECEECVEKGGKTFCCENCCKDFEERSKKPKEEEAGICKFC
jgi:hypothetical protein